MHPFTVSVSAAAWRRCRVSLPGLTDSAEKTSTCARLGALQLID
jgi:hypothetical protein